MGVTIRKLVKINLLLTYFRQKEHSVPSPHRQRGGMRQGHEERILPRRFGQRRPDSIQVAPIDLECLDVVAGRDEHSPARRGHQVDEGAVVGQLHVKHLKLCYVDVIRA